MTPHATILTCAVTGNQTMREQNPALPVTPAEIASSAVDAARAGAAIVHLHARDPATGRGTTRAELFDEIVARIRDAGCDVILNLSTGEGGRFMPSEDDPKVAAPGSTLMRPELRVAHVERLQPEVCTLDFNTMFSGSSVVINTPRNLEIMAQARDRRRRDARDRDLRLGRPADGARVRRARHPARPPACGRSCSASATARWPIRRR